MSATIVQATKVSDNTAQDPSASMSVSCSAGNAVILVIGLVTKTRTISSVSDSASNAGWVHVVGGGGSTSGYCDIWWNPSLAASITSIQLDYSGTTKCAVGVLEVSGLTGVADSGAATTNHTTAATTAASSITTTNADDFIVAGFGAVTNATSVDSPFVAQTGANGGGVGINMFVGAVEETSAASYTATFHSTSETSTTSIAAFKVSSSAVSGTAASTVSFTGTAAGHIISRGTAASTVSFTGAAAGTVIGAATGLRNNAEGGSNGTTVTTGNSGGTSGDAFNAVAGTPTFSSTQAAHGTLSYQVATGAELDWTHTAASDGYGRAYVFLTSGAQIQIVGLLSAASKWNIIAGTSTFVLKNASFTTVGTGTSLTAGQWYRIEWHHSSASQLEVKVWNSMDSSGTPDQDITASSGTNSNVDQIAYPGTSVAAAYLDDLNGFATAWPGPAQTHTIISAAAASAVTFTGAAAGAATHHASSGTATGTVTFTGSAAGTATHHHYAGTAASSAAFTGAATGRVTIKASAATAVSFAGAASASAGFHTLHNDFESGQTSGTTITTGNSGVGTDNPFDTVTGAVKYSNVQAHGGSLSMLTLPAAGSSVHWGAASLGPGAVTIYGRVYLWMDSVPTTAPAFVEASGDVHSNILRITGVSPGGTLKVVANDGTANSQTLGSVAVALSQWVRIEWQMTISAGTAAIAYQLFNTPESLTPDENISTSRSVTDTVFTDIQVGPSSSPSPAIVYYDDLALSNTASPGPTGATAISGTAASTVTITGAATGTATHHVSSGVAAGVVTVTGAATGRVTRRGVASGTVTVTGAATGSATHHHYAGTAAGSVSFTGAAAGTSTHHLVSATAAGTVTVTGGAAGAATHHHYAGTATGVVSFTGLAVAGGGVHGVAAGTVTVTGAAAGTASHHHYAGTAAISVTFTGAATGRIVRHGSGAMSVAWLGVAAATDTHHVYLGVAHATIAISGGAAGSATRHAYAGSAQAIVVFTGVAVGHSSGLITLDIAALWNYHETGRDPYPVAPGLTLNVHQMFSQRYRDLSKPFPTNEDPTITVNLERLWNQKYEDTSVPFPLDRA